MKFPRVAKLNSFARFLEHWSDLSFSFPLTELTPQQIAESFSQNVNAGNKTVGNRFAILPMEGWDGTSDGKPTDLTVRRWQNFGKSGAKLIWGGEAVAVRHDGRANPNQLLINDQNLRQLESLRLKLVESHIVQFGNCDDLLVGIQLTHSGRFARPNQKDKLEPRTAFNNRYLDRKYKTANESQVFDDDEVKTLIDDFLLAARLASKIGFEFVDIKCCHGYLGHELLSAYQRPGQFGGSFENRTRFVREIIEGITSQLPALEIGVRLSIFDFVPFEAGFENIGKPVTDAEHPIWCGKPDQTFDLTEAREFLAMLEKLGVKKICTTAGSPYTTPHIQRPAAFPPSDGYLPPEDPLVGVARQIRATAELKQKHPGLLFVGSGYSYLQEWLPTVGANAINNNLVDLVGIGRMVLSYPEMPSDVLGQRELARKKICRTFSDCTTAPRNGIISGCFPLDPFYKDRPEAAELVQIKRSHERR